MRQVQGNFNFIQAYTLPKILSEKPGFILVELGKTFENYLEQRLHSIQLGRREFTVLLAISEIGPISQQRLSDLLQIDRTTMVFLLDELQKMKLVQRNANPEDRRAHALIVTSAAKTLLKRAMLIVEEAQIEFTSGLTREENRQLDKLILKLFMKTQQDFL